MEKKRNSAKYITAPETGKNRNHIRSANSEQFDNALYDQINKQLKSTPLSYESTSRHENAKTRDLRAQ